ncbi:MAG TPA: glycoside hydrolase family 2 TIM barrel-domain containing protein [Candidatus Acidoferrum sp.]|nr:glycoside hydrolase family 2 TIM barrel-domain containing protein [Candidatus Acidoferrum sp.]
MLTFSFCKKARVFLISSITQLYGSRVCVALLAACFAFPASAFSQTANTTVLADVDHRLSISLNGDWHSIVDPYATGLYTFHGEIRADGFFLNRHYEPNGPLVEYDFAKSPVLHVPGDWNTQRPSLYEYEGLVWYEKDFDFQPKPSTRTFLHIGAANYHAIVWVNTKQICEHEGGFTAFDCEITSVLHPGSNFVVIAVDDTRHADGVPTVETDWWNYGGLTRDVSLVEVPDHFIDDFDLHLNRADTSEIDGWVHVVNAAPGESVRVSIPEAHLDTSATVAANGLATLTLHASHLDLWSPEHPKLYRVELSSGSDKLEDEIGFRTVEVRGTQILLNGKPIFLRGVSIHGEAPYRTGRANTDQDVATIFSWVHELGANYVRLAHYPHDQRMTRTADKMGILVWSEIPVYWAVQFENPAVLAKAQQQLGEMIRRDRDKASVILWSVANETPNTAARTQFLKTLVENAHEIDPTRLVTAALLVRTEGTTKVVDDPLGQYLDVLGANEYLGWYEGPPDAIEQHTWNIAYSKPLIISEFGAGAKAGLHGDLAQRWTEEYQANVYRHQLVMLNRISQLRGMTPWVLMDFRSPRRLLPGIQDDFNRKGLVSDQGEKKQAFYVLQKAYRDRSVGKAD